MTDSQKLHFGIKTTQYFSYEDILRVWQEAETLPSIEHAWLFDHPMPIMRADPSGPCLDGWTLLAALAAQTKRLVALDEGLRSPSIQVGTSSWRSLLFCHLPSLPSLLQSWPRQRCNAKG